MSLVSASQDVSRDSVPFLEAERVLIADHLVHERETP
jgi:hypothetical protein